MSAALLGLGVALPKTGRKASRTFAKQARRCGFTRGVERTQLRATAPTRPGYGRSSRKGGVLIHPGTGCGRRARAPRRARVRRQVRGGVGGDPRRRRAAGDACHRVRRARFRRAGASPPARLSTSGGASEPLRIRPAASRLVVVADTARDALSDTCPPQELAQTANEVNILGVVAVAFFILIPGELLFLLSCALV